MATYIGKPMEQLFAATLNQQKGIVGEQLVLQQLLKYCPDDATVVGMPQIGRYEPDFLVLHPTFGIRIIEVKNYSLDGMKEARINGLLVFRNNSTSNPMQQAKSQTDSVIQLLEREFPQHFVGKAPVGYLVVHTGFTRVAFEQKFSKFKESSGYWKHHMTLDEFDGSVVERLRSAAKFSGGLYLQAIQDVLHLVQYRETFASEASVLKLEMESKLAHLEQKMEQKMKEAAQPASQDNKPRRKSMAVLVLALVLIFGVGGWVFLHRDMPPTDPTVQAAEIGRYNGQRISISGSVQRFYFDQGSGTKFIVIQDLSGQINGVIFKDRKVPLIKEGGSYSFYGEVGKYQGNYQIVIDNVTSK